MTYRPSNLLPRDVGFLIAGGIAAVALSGTAIAVTDTNFTYTAAKTGYLSIHPMDLAPPTDDISFIIDYAPARLRLIDGTCANTGINLPQGARVVSLLTYYSASNAIKTNPRVLLFRNNLATDITNTLVDTTVVETSGARNSVISIVPAPLSIINNGVFSYGFAICLGQLDTFEGARIAYRYGTAGD